MIRLLPLYNQCVNTIDLAFFVEDFRSKEIVPERHQCCGESAVRQRPVNKATVLATAKCQNSVVGYAVSAGGEEFIADRAVEIDRTFVTDINERAAARYIDKLPRII